MLNQGDIISYLEMCQEEGVNLQRGMNFRLNKNYSVILMSIRNGAPYSDAIEDNGETLIYEGHDVPNTKDVLDPKKLDQQLLTSFKKLTENGKFYGSAQHYKLRKGSAELVRVYEKIKDGIWSYSGMYKLIDSWQEESIARKVYKFKLKLTEDKFTIQNTHSSKEEHSRIIPTFVKLAVWKRDKGKCIMCGSASNLHFDHIIPYSKGGSSLVADNIQILCAKHNLEKHDRIDY